MPIPGGFAPVASQTITDHVYQHLRQAIHVGRLKPGQRLIDTELAEALQVSRATVREALRMLESRGLVTIKHRRGAFRGRTHAGRSAGRLYLPHSTGNPRRAIGCTFCHRGGIGRARTS